MWGTKKVPEKTVSTIDAELELFQARREVEIMKEITELEVKSKLHWANDNVVARQQLNKFEHDFHQTKEDRMAIVHKLDGEIKAKKEYITQLNTLMEIPSNLIERLLKVLEKQNISLTANNNVEQQQ